MAVYDIVAGSTGTMEFQLLENGVPIDLTKSTVSLLLEDRSGNDVLVVDGVIVFDPGTVTVSDATSGKIQFTPTTFGTQPGPFVAGSGPYYARWKLVNSALVSYVPSTGRDMWNIVGL